MFENVNWGDLVERSAWTFAQAFLGVFAVANIGDIEAVKAAAVAGVAAGVSAVLSLVKNIVKQQHDARQVEAE